MEKARRVVQVIECLLSQHVTLSSNPTITKKKKKKEKKRNKKQMKLTKYLSQ
jgi:hypothetical protein